MVDFLWVEETDIASIAVASSAKKLESRGRYDSEMSTNCNENKLLFNDYHYMHSYPAVADSASRSSSNRAGGT